MMNRRRTLLVISGVTFGGVVRAKSSLVRLIPSALLGKQAASNTQLDLAGKAADDRLPGLYESGAEQHIS
jgi:hypothetical protein